MTVRRVAPGVLAGFALLLATAALRAQCPDGTPPPCGPVARAAATRPVPPPAERARSLVLLPFRNVTRAEADAWLVHGAPVMLAEALGQWRELTVVPDEQLAAVLRRRRLEPDQVPDADQLQHLARETGGWTAVTGDVLTTGGLTRVTARAIDVPTRRVLVRGEEHVRPGEDVRTAFDRLSLVLLRTAGLEARTGDIVARTTQSIDAYRAYVRGLALTRQSAFRRARDAFAEAVRLDSAFAPAWARLAYASAVWNGQVLLDPRSDAYRHAERAAALAPRLPERERRLVLAIAGGFRGQFTQSRRVLEQLVAADSNDLDALELLSLVELLDPMLDTTASQVTLRASFNRATLLARRVLELDPDRRHVHAIFLYAYGTAGGVWGGALWGFRREAASLAATFLRQPDETFVPVLRDSFVVVPSDSFRAMPRALRDSLRRRAVAAASTWVDRWLSAGPDDSEAWMWASRVAGLREDWEAALRAVWRAESLGVGSQMDHPAARRVELLYRLGRVSEAASVADSLAEAGYYRTAWVEANPLGERPRAWGLAAVLAARRWQRAPEIASGGRARETERAMCRHAADLLWRVPGAAPSDTVVRYAALFRASGLGRCLPDISGTGYRDSMETRRTGPPLMAAAESLLVRGDSDGAFGLAFRAFGRDTSLAARVRDAGWYLQRLERVRLDRRIVPRSAVSHGDSLVLEWLWRDRQPLVWDDPALSTLPSLGFGFRLRNQDSTFGASAVHPWPPHDERRQGTLTTLAGDLTSRSAYAWAGNRTLPEAAATTVRAAVMDSVLRLVVIGGVASTVRRLRPSSVTFWFGGCVRDPRDSAASCDVEVPVTYR